MQRVIKFRAWDITMNVMESVCELTFTDDGRTSGIRIGNSKGSVGFYNFSEDTIKLMQFINLLDKNGKEIYEGDIIGYQFADRKLLYQVQWLENGFWVVEGDGSHNMPAESYREVIGNIYENPELLKQ